MGMISTIYQSMMDRYERSLNLDQKDQNIRASLIRRINELAKEYLTSADAKLIIEVEPANMKYMPMVLTDEKLQQSYHIKQIDEYLYEVSLQTFTI